MSSISAASALVNPPYRGGLQCSRASLALGCGRSHIGHSVGTCGLPPRLPLIARAAFCGAVPANPPRRPSATAAEFLGLLISLLPCLPRLAALIVDAIQLGTQILLSPARIVGLYSGSACLTDSGATDGAGHSGSDAGLSRVAWHLPYAISRSLFVAASHT